MTKRSTEHVASITRTVTLEWPAFTKKLTSVLCGLKDEEFLILQAQIELKLHFWEDQMLENLLY